MKQFEETVDALLGAQRIVMAGHVNPDGDTLGCILALGYALRTLDKDVTLLSADGVPDIYRWMPGAETVQTSTDRADFDLAVVCDAGAINRVGKSIEPIVLSAPKMIDIDHHVTDGTAFGDFRILDQTASATAEIIYELLVRLSARTGQSLHTSEEVAECLMTGIITDTGSFRYPNVTPATFRIAGELLACGARPAPINELVFENRTYASLKLLGRALDGLQTTEDGKVAWATVTAADFAEFDAQDSDTEGIVNHVRAVRTAMVGILFREIPGKKVRISLRAREGADVNQIANVFDGGGHRLAAGCSLEPPLDEVVSKVVAEAQRQLA